MDVSIIVPVYNRAAFLPRLFASLLRQRQLPREIILVDNASTDESRTLCLAFKSQNDKVLPISVLSENKRGAAACRNAGLRAAKAEFVYFFDSDDELDSEFLADAAVYAASDVIAAPTRMVFASGREKIRRTTFSADPADQILCAMLSTQSMIVRRSFLVSLGGWNEGLPRWNDWELGVRILLQHPRITWLRGRSYHKIHQHAASISGGSLERDTPVLIRALKAVESDIIDMEQVPSARQRQLRALCGKSLLLAAEMKRQGFPASAAEVCRQTEKTEASALFRACSALLYRLSCLGVPGMWRIFLKII